MDLSFSIKEITGAFMVLFAIIDITGSIPIILDLKNKGNNVDAKFATIASFALFVLFLFVGERLLSLFGVDIQSFAVAGSVILFVMALEMILGIEIMKNDGPKNSATLVPIVFPLIAGAGTLTTLLSMRAAYHVENIIVAITLNVIFIYFVLSKIDKIEKIFGKNFIYILRKFFGIILLAMAAKLFATNISALLGN